MATIDRRRSKVGKITYRVRVRFKGYPLQTATFKRRTDAKHWAQQTEAAIREGRYFPKAEAKKHTLGELVDRYIEKVLPGKRSAKDWARALRWWKDQIGACTLADVTPALIVEYRDILAEGT